MELANGTSPTLRTPETDRLGTVMKNKSQNEITREQKRRLARAIQAIILATRPYYPHDCVSTGFSTSTGSPAGSPSISASSSPRTGSPKIVSSFAKRRNVKRLSLAM